MERDQREKDIQDTELLRFTPSDLWRVRDAVEGLQVFGATGSGKTSGSGSTVARAFLRPREHFGGFGGLVLTAKADELDAWRGHLEATGRTSDLVVLQPDHGQRFNFLRYEFNRPRDQGGQLTLNVVAILLAALTSGTASVSKEDPYWEEALRELLTHAVDLAVLATCDERGYAPLDLDQLFRIVRSAPQTPEEAASRSWRSSSDCARHLVAAERRRGKLDELGREFSRGRQTDLDETMRYWLQDFPRLSDRTRSIVVSSFTAKVSGLLRSPMRQLFCSEASEDGDFDCGTPDVLPDRTFEGKVIVVALPVKLFGEVGRVAQVLYKSVWQKAVERRQLVGDWRPVFLWADEAQFFVSKDDTLYQSTARSQLAATVYLTQNRPSYGQGLSGQGPDVLLGNLQTKIFHANGDPDTNEWASRLFGDVYVPDDPPQGEQVVHVARRSTKSVPVVEARAFTLLRKGDTSPLIDAYVFQGGRHWKRPVPRRESDPRNFGKVCFDRDLKHVHLDDPKPAP